jgi:hypothetical protein
MQDPSSHRMPAKNAGHRYAEPGHANDTAQGIEWDDGMVEIN